MSDGTGMKDGMDMGEAARLDVQGAAVIIQEARERAGRELRVRRPVLFLSWGLVLLIGYGAMWLSVREQHPYSEPAVWALGLLGLLFIAAAIVTAQVVDRAASGVGGRSEVQRVIFCVAVIVGAAALEIEKYALGNAGATRPQLAVLGASAPMLAAGLVLLASSAVTAKVDWPRLAVGLWLLAVACGGAWGGPVTDLAVCALAGGGGILLMAAIEPRLRRS
jgi:hypothetical protein